MHDISESELVRLNAMDEWKHKNLSSKETCLQLLRNKRFARSWAGHTPGFVVASISGTIKKIFPFTKQVSGDLETVQTHTKALDDNDGQKERVITSMSP